MDKYIKRFRRWLSVSEKLEENDNTPPLFKEGEIWWCHIGENIGTEICGKGEMFDRPVLIIRKLDKQSFIGLPILGKTKKGDWYVPIQVQDREVSVFLAQVKYLDYRRMDNLITTVGETEFQEISSRFIDFMTINIPRPSS
jgi:mRNA interferase MazF